MESRFSVPSSFPHPFFKKSKLLCLVEDHRHFYYSHKIPVSSLRIFLLQGFIAGSLFSFFFQTAPLVYHFLAVHAVTSPPIQRHQSVEDYHSTRRVSVSRSFCRLAPSSLKPWSDCALLLELIQSSWRDSTPPRPLSSTLSWAPSSGSSAGATPDPLN